MMKRAAVFFALLFAFGCSRGTQEAPAFQMNDANKDLANPFPTRTQTWELGENHDPEIILVNGTYYMFYAGAAVAGVAPMRIGVQSTSVASYPYGWMKYGSNPVLEYNTQSMDTILISSPHPIQMQDGSFRLYYHGYNGSINQLGYATTDNASFPAGWTKSGSNPIFTVGAPGAWDDVDLRPAEVIIPPWLAPDNTWHLLYGGYDGTNWRAGHATSNDGVAWTRDGSNPVANLGAGGAWDSHDVLPVGWFVADGTYYILYQGSNNAKWEVGYFTTTDFSTYTKGANNPILTVGASGQWDHTTVENPGAVYHSNTRTVDLWYVGTDEAFVVNGSKNYRIGLATTAESNGTLKGSMLGNVR